MSKSLWCEKDKTWSVERKWEIIYHSAITLNASYLMPLIGSQHAFHVTWHVKEKWSKCGIPMSSSCFFCKRLLIVKHIDKVFLYYLFILFGLHISCLWQNSIKFTQPSSDLTDLFCSQGLYFVGQITHCNVKIKSLFLQYLIL